MGPAPVRSRETINEQVAKVQVAEGRCGVGLETRARSVLPAVLPRA